MSGYIVPRNPSAEELQRAIEQREVDVNSLTFFKKGWKATKKNFCGFYGILILYMLITLATFMVSGFVYVRVYGVPDMPHFPEEHDHEVNHEAMHKWMESIPKSLIIWVVVTFAMVYFFLGRPFFASFIKASFNALRTNTRLSCRTAFGAFSCPYYCRLLWLTVCFTFVSFIFGGISAFLASFFFMFSYGLHVDNPSLGVWHSFKFSVQAVVRHFCGVLAFAFLTILVNLVGLLFFGVGLFVTLPLTWFAWVYLYHEVIRINQFPTAANAVAPQAASVPLRSIQVVDGVALTGARRYQPLGNDFSNVEGAC